MGGDGQALTNSRKLLSQAKQFVDRGELEADDHSKEKNSEKTRIIERWSNCALSLTPLEPPLAFDIGGNVFTKAHVIDYLIARKKGTTLYSEGGHFDIKKMSDICEIKNETSASGEIRCPIKNYSTTSGLHHFLGFWGCGHVVSVGCFPANAVEISEGKSFDCPVCGEASFPVALVLPEEKERAQRKKLGPLLKGSKKRKREEDH
ncbi:hypothetical protein STCU_01345 [Strigomonas culicis]|uniref:Replication termination factor 2 n=1 Tax=Strigomonas culicis TaxID=28005 RepID=S9UV08_9TRYP|nr:hypothetical protein STCU_01345 [Strigomonas culicis]|eukprot:EPY34757.1 hypothetical protein STCU_01345 [Strigomonas culicis]